MVASPHPVPTATEVLGQIRLLLLAVLALLHRVERLEQPAYQEARVERFHLGTGPGVLGELLPLHGAAAVAQVGQVQTLPLLPGALDPMLVDARSALGQMPSLTDVKAHHALHVIGVDPLEPLLLEDGAAQLKCV